MTETTGPDDARTGTPDTGAARSGDPRSIFSKELLDRCISCGFCLPACPTYALTGDEASSPRGRITLMRALETGRLDEDDPSVAEQASYCLGCRACESACPAGVEYGALLEEWRDHQWRGRRRPWPARLLMAVVSRPGLLRLQGLLRRHARTPPAPEGPSLLLGCVERGLYPEVSRAALRLSPELAAPSGQGCCGALHAHNGDSAAGEAMARAVGERLPGTIVTTAGGCAAHLARHLGRERVRELSEYLAEGGPATGDDGAGGTGTGTPGAVSRPAGTVRVDGRRARVALQDSCHLRHGMGVTRQPRDLIASVADYVEVAGADDCCGAAGTYALLRPDDSRAVLDPKLDAIEGAGVDYVTVVNPGCLRQLRQGLRRRRSRVQALHLAELLDRAEQDAPPRDIADPLPRDARQPDPTADHGTG